MTSLARTFEHNAWANRQVLEGLRGAPAGFLDQESRPGGGTNREKLQHLAIVERGFHDAILAGTRRPEVAGDLESIIAYCEENRLKFAALLASELDLEAEVHIPWWERDFTIGDCLAQVLSHTAQHRSELAWELARAGIDTGEMDYIVWFAEHRGD